MEGSLGSMDTGGGWKYAEDKGRHRKQQQWERVFLVGIVMVLIVFAMHTSIGNWNLIVP